MLHLTKCHIYKGIVFGNRPLSHGMHASYAFTTQTQRKVAPKKNIQLTDIPATQWPPINPKLWDYEAQKGPQKQKQETTHQAINVGALFLLAGFICGGIISKLQPNDFRNDFKFHSPLPDTDHTKISGNVPLNMAQTSKIKNETSQDWANAITYSLFLGSGCGLAGNLWYRMWTHPLRIKSLNEFELGETVSTLRANSIRNCIKGTFCGSGAILAMIYVSVFYSYLYLGQFYRNKYVDTSFWDYMELMYQRNVEGLKEYEFNLELQQRLNEKSVTHPPPIAPAFNSAQDIDNIDIDMATDENYEIINEAMQKEKAKKEKMRDSLKKTMRGMEWDTDLYLNTKDISYYKLSDNAKAVRWNIAREMATLACSCSLYIVLPVFCVANIYATRMYSNYWKHLIREMIKTKQMPLKTY